MLRSQFNCGVSDLMSVDLDQSPLSATSAQVGGDWLGWLVIKSERRVMAEVNGTENRSSA